MSTPFAQADHGGGTCVEAPGGFVRSTQPGALKNEPPLMPAMPPPAPDMAMEPSTAPEPVQTLERALWTPQPRSKIRRGDTLTVQRFGAPLAKRLASGGGVQAFNRTAVVSGE